MPHERVKCPFPDCTHVGEMITIAHCRIAHGMEREEVRKLYGFPYKVTYLHGALNHASVDKWRKAYGEN